MILVLLVWYSIVILVLLVLLVLLVWYSIVLLVILVLLVLLVWSSATSATSTTGST